MSQQKNAQDSIDAPSGSLFMPGEKLVIWVVWLTYGAFYLCRANLSVAMPGIKDDLGFSKTDMAVVLLSTKIAYAIGQLVNGQLAERFSPRKMLAIGMLGSAALNVIFGLGSALYFFVFVWACNGYCQSLGWTPCMRVTANWIPVQRRGKAIGIIGTGYQLALGLTFVISAFAISTLNYGWRGAFFVPPILLAGAAIHMLFFMRETPETDALPAHQDSATHHSEQVTGNFLDNLKITLSNRKLWLLAVSLGMLNACRYGFIDWGITHLMELQPEGSRSILKEAIKYAVLPVGAFAGSYLAGWATDRFFGSRRAPVICGALVLLTFLTLLYDRVAHTSLWGTLVLLGLIGFMIFAAQVLLVGTAPADLAAKGTAAAAAGFVNFMGYVGAAVLGDLLTGYLADNYGWKVAINAWAGWSLAAAITVGFLWHATGDDAQAASDHVEEKSE